MKSDLFSARLRVGVYAMGLWIIYAVGFCYFLLHLGQSVTTSTVQLYELIFIWLLVVVHISTLTGHGLSMHYHHLTGRYQPREWTRKAPLKVLYWLAGIGIVTVLLTVLGFFGVYWLAVSGLENIVVALMALGLVAMLPGVCIGLGGFMQRRLCMAPIGR